MRQIFAYAFAVLLAAGCMMDRKDVYDTDVPLVFHPTMYVQAKSAESAQYPAGQPFAVDVWVMGKDCLWENRSSCAQEYAESCDVHPGQKDEWIPLDMLLWPSVDKAVAVIGYSPVEAFEDCDAVRGAVASINTAESQQDLLYTDPQIGHDKFENGGVMNMPFRHALAQVDFMVKNRVTKDEMITIRKISVDGVCHSGVFSSLETPMWRLDEGKASFEFFAGEQETSHVPSPVGRSYLMLPQDLNTSVTVEYQYTTATSNYLVLELKTVPLKTRLEPGRHYTYTLSVGIDDVKFLQEIIEDRF